MINIFSLVDKMLVDNQYTLIIFCEDVMLYEKTLTLHTNMELIREEVSDIVLQSSFSDEKLRPSPSLVFNLNVVKQNNNPFDDVIPTRLIRKSEKPIFLYLSMDDLYNTSSFKHKVENCLIVDGIYTVFVKVRYNIDSFFIAGNQFGFEYKNINSINDLLSCVNIRLEQYFSSYNLTDESIIYIQLSFSKLDKKLVSEFKLEKKDHNDNKLISYKNITKQILSVPVSINKNSLGNPLNITVDTDGNISFIYLNLKGKLVNFLDTIKSRSILLRDNHVDNINSFKDT